MREPIFRAGVVPEERSDVRTVTFTIKDGGQLHSFVASSVASGYALVTKRWPKARVLSVSTPRSIYRDITGETERRTTRRGLESTTHSRADSEGVQARSPDMEAWE